MDPFEALQRVAQPLGEAIRMTAGPTAEHPGSGGRPPADRRPGRDRRVRQGAGAQPGPLADPGGRNGQRGRPGLHSGPVPRPWPRRRRRDTFTVPAMNLRALPYHAARAVFRAAREGRGQGDHLRDGPLRDGLHRSAPGGVRRVHPGSRRRRRLPGPVFIQGDHFQISAKKYASKPAEEVKAVTATDSTRRWQPASTTSTSTPRRSST